MPPTTPPPLTPELKHFVAFDKRLTEVGRRIKVLRMLDWPGSHAETFLKGWRAGNPTLPVIEHPRPDYSAECRELAAIMDAVDRTHPIGEYIFQTAESYWMAAQMLESMGTMRFTELSIGIYGRPTDPIGPGGLTHLDAAEQFVASTRECIAAYIIDEKHYNIPAAEVATRIRETLLPYFADHKVEVLLDPHLMSKASAGSQRIRVRDNTTFSEKEVTQLLNHEGLVHMLTSLNGKNQPYLGSMALGSPRTTKTQEGLATFSELHTSSIDLNRLRRIALRIPAVQKALDGANFLEIFNYFHDATHDPEESFQSAVRVFRGGDPKGGIVFTKDSVYLQGLILTHTFLRKSVQENKFHFAEYLLAGRLTWGDVVNLEQYFVEGFIAPPRYEPPWLTARECLAAYLCYAVFANQISLGNIRLEDFRK